MTKIASHDVLYAISFIEACVHVAEIKAWVDTNKLMLTGNQTVIFVFSAIRHGVSCDVHHINIDVHE